MYEPPRRSLQEDSAPTDWSYVQSVEEGLRKRQAQNMRDRKEPRDHHRTDPYGVQSVDHPSVARSVLPAVNENSPFLIPENMRRTAAASREPEAAVSAPSAQPARQNEVPVQTAPGFAPEAGQAAEPAKQPRRRRAQIVSEDGSRFEKPAELQIPEWLRVAQQNATPESVRRPPAPRVQAAPPLEENRQYPRYGQASRTSNAPIRQADMYAAAGYPPELLEAQRKLDERQELEQLRKHHGAMAAARKEEEPQPQQQPSAAAASSYPPPRRDLSPEEAAARMQAIKHYNAAGSRRAADRPAQRSAYMAAVEQSAYLAEPGEERPRIRIPWLGVLAFAAVLATVLLWVGQLQNDQKLEKVYLARAQAQQRVADEHPYEYRELIEAQAEQYNLHPAFVAAIVLNESSFRPGVKSSADAMGLMQIRPDTGEYINRALDLPGYNHEMLYDPDTNIRFGCYYLGEMSQRFGGDPVLVAAAYNAGPTNVQNWLNNSTYSADRRTIPIENIPFGDTQTYARRVLRDYAAYKRLYYENPEAGL
ncbi:MAG: transglycosylase SLT domain-containing protein [Clostridia bacterium]|nr:transglycosylase SLT domain-containing protein [Clostridia bacterium]